MEKDKDEKEYQQNYQTFVRDYKAGILKTNYWYLYHKGKRIHEVSSEDKLFTSKQYLTALEEGTPLIMQANSDYEKHSGGMINTHVTQIAIHRGSGQHFNFF